MNRYSKYASVFFSIFVVAGCSATSVRENPDFASGSQRIKTVAILPPEVEYISVGLGGVSERLTDRERTIARELFQGFKTKLEAKHYVVVAPDAVAPNGVGAQDVQKLRLAYREVAKRLYDNSANDIHDSTVGPLAKPVADQVKADAVIVARYAGYEKSTAAAIGDVAVGSMFGAMTGTAIIQAPRGYILEVALIDGVTGKVLWINRGNRRPVVRKEDAQVGETGIAGYVISNLPERSSN